MGQVKIKDKNLAACMKISDSVRAVKKADISVISCKCPDLGLLDIIYGKNVVTREKNMRIKYKIETKDKQVDINCLFEKKAEDMDMVMVISEYWF